MAIFGARGAIARWSATCLTSVVMFNAQPREHQPEAGETPFDSIERAHEYVTLLAVQVGVVRDALRTISRTPPEKPPAGASTRFDWSITSSLSSRIT